MMSSSKRSAKISNASTVSNASSNLTVPNALSGLSDDEGTYQALSVVFEDSTDPRKKSKGQKIGLDDAFEVNPDDIP